MPTPESVAALLSAAASRHQAGDLESAGAQYRSILEQVPDHPEALYLAGALAHQRGMSDEAFAKLERAVTLRPDHVPALEMLGAVAAKLGKLELAARCFETAATRKQTSPEAHTNAGRAFFSLRSYTKAIHAFREALRHDPRHQQARYFLATALRIEGRLQEAAEAYAVLLAAQPAHARALDEYGGVLFDLGRVAEAEAVLRRATAAAPGEANPYTNLGRIFQTDAARADEALALHDSAIARNPDYAEAHNNRGVALYTLSRFDEAIVSFRKAIALKPGMAEAFNNLGNALYRIGDSRGAVESFDDATALKHDYAEAHWNKAVAHLAQGAWRAGWASYEWRWQCRDFPFPRRGFPQPLWHGESIPDGKLLVWGEQGVGDEILYLGMVGDLAKRGVSIVLETDARLIPLVNRSFRGVQAVARRDPADSATSHADIKAQSPSGSLGRYLRAAPEDFPATRNGYLEADAERVRNYRTLMCKNGKKRVIGVSWISKNPEFGMHKTLALTALAPLWEAAGTDTHFVDLQYGNTAAERAASQLDLSHLDDLDLFGDLDGLAALIAACDLVVTVSNTTAHLAGALGVPVWVLAPTGNGKLWYWGNGQNHAPWYPSAIVFRQSLAGDWPPVIARVAQRLAAET